MGSNHLVKHFLWQGYPSSQHISENNHQLEFHVGRGQPHSEGEPFDPSRVELCGKWAYTTRPGGSGIYGLTCDTAVMGGLVLVRNGQSTKFYIGEVAVYGVQMEL